MRKINLSIAVFCRENEAEICRKMYFSTDLTQNGQQLVSYYPLTLSS